MAADYRRTGLSVGVHPLDVVAPTPPRKGRCGATICTAAATSSQVAYAGLAIARQRPSTANGIVFMLLEDECGQVNLIVPKAVYERHRAIVRNEPLLFAHGRYERVGENRNILVSWIETLGGSRAGSPISTSEPPCRGRTTSAIASGSALGAAAPPPWDQKAVTRFGATSLS